MTMRVIGGTEATKGRYSYAVSLQDKFGHFCGGSLIAKDIVLSAAHCMGTEGGYNQDPGYNAVIGRHNLNTTEGVEVSVKTEITHPDYDWGTTNNDFMILVLNQSITGAGLVRVSPDIVPVGQGVTVMGWGDTDIADHLQTMPDELMETEVFVVSNEECDQSKGTAGGGYELDYHGQITENMLCAEDVTAEDACQGDSGGPLVIKDSSGDLQVGVVSWGISCAHDDFPGVYSRISAQYEWIRQQVCAESSEPPASFECESLALQASSNVGGWTPIVSEDFAGGFGMFDRHGNDATHYNAAMNRDGVVRIHTGEGGISTMKSNTISIQSSTFTRIKVSFSFYAIAMDHSDDLCLDYEIDDGAITGEKCWSSLHAFELSRWYDDMSFEFSSSNAQNLSIRFSVKGDDVVDEVMISSVSIEGLE